MVTKYMCSQIHTPFSIMKICWLLCCVLCTVHVEHPAGLCYAKEAMQTAADQARTGSVHRG